MPGDNFERGEVCQCWATSPAPDAFDGIFHWRADCAYLNAAEKRAVLVCYGEPDEALRRWREERDAHRGP